MKKSKLITLLITTIISLFLMASFVHAENNIFPTTGNVGIGTTTPDGKLEISGENHSVIGEGGTYDSWKLSDGGTGDPGYLSLFYNNTLYTQIGPTSAQIGGNGVFNITPYGRIGIGTPNPDFSSGFFGLNISDLNNEVIDPAIRLSENGSGNGNFEIRSTRSGSGNMIQIGEGSDTFLTIRSDDDDGGTSTRGNIGIGTTNPQSKLAVNGTITTKEVKVTKTGWSDFVFEKDYDLPSLEKVESYIKENKHLPDIPSAKHIEEEGLSMAEMMKKQMQKIEELTLYVIELKKENETLKERVAILEKE